MPFIGNQPAESYASFETETFSVSATANYTLSHAVTNENEIRLVINGVVQQPGSGKAYTASGTTLTLTSATVSGDVMYCVYLGRALQTVNPPNASVGNSQTAPTIITGQTAETSIATDDTILIHDTSASALRKMTRANFVSGIGGTMTPAFYVRKNASQSCSNNTATQVTYQTEIVDTDNAFASNTFTVPSGKNGAYFLFAQIRFESDADFSYIINEIKVNDSPVFSGWNRNIDYSTVYVSGFANLSAGDTVKHVVTQGSGGTINIGSTDRGAVTYLGGYKIIE